jgi:23S rRNA pseudouridine1911/1915/1917 synthase
MDAMDLQILYEDNHLLVCIKPPGVLSQSNGTDVDDMLSLGKTFLKIKYQKPGNVFLGLVHRLDRNVGGVMVFAKTSKAASRLSSSIRNHEFKKKYMAVIESKMVVGEVASYEDYLEKDEESLKSNLSSQGKKSELTYRVIDSLQMNGKWLSLLEIDLKTGRFHQIRTQFSSRGLPLYGDQKYGGSKQSEPIGLWATYLIFPHPITNQLLEFETIPLNPVFSVFFNRP